MDSVLSQDYPDLEYLVIDGGSNDETAALLEEYQKRLGYWVSEPDAGQSDAVNKGFRRARGDLVAWLNADDYYLPGTLQAVATAYRNQPTAPFYFGDGHRVDEQGKVKEGFFPDGDVLFDSSALLYGLNYILQPSTFINRTYIEQVGYLDLNLKYGMDSDLWMKLSALGQPVAIGRALSASREYGDTKTASGMFERVEELRQISQRHSGAEITPGVMCYFLHTLHRYSMLREDIWDAKFRSHNMEPFWLEVQKLLARYNARSDGFPDRSLLSNEGHVDGPGGLSQRIKSLAQQFLVAAGLKDEEK